MSETSIDARRPLLQRLMPVSWVLLAILGLFAVLAGCTAARDQRIAQENAAIATQEAVAAARVTATSVPSPTRRSAAATVTLQPTRDETPTPAPAKTPELDGTAAFFATLAPQQTRAVAEATAASAATQAIATYTPAPPTPTIFPEGYRPPWADKMVQQPDGTWMAPPEVVEQARRHYQEFYDYLLNGGYEELSNLSTSELRLSLSRYLTGSRFQVWVSSYEGFKTLWSQAKGTRLVAFRVHSFSPDGMFAKADLNIDSAGWTEFRKSDRKVIRTLTPYKRIDTDWLVFDPADQRWKLCDELVRVPQG